jgi:hypothetical protein
VFCNCDKSILPPKLSLKSHLAAFNGRVNWPYGAKELSLTTLSIMTLSIIGLFVTLG